MLEKEEGLKNESLVQLALDNSRTLLLVIIISMGVSFAGSFLMKPKYKSTLILFPASQNSISESIIKGGQGFLDFGDEVQTEKMIQILKSNDIRDKIIEIYDLYEHYDIGKDEKNAKTKVTEEYKENVRFKKNEYMSVEVTVYDTEPVVAANIANSIGELLDSVHNEIQRKRAIKGLEILDDKLIELNNHIDQLEDSMKVFHDLGILDFNSQVAVYSEFYARSVSEDNTAAADTLKERLKTFAKNGVDFIALQDNLIALKKMRENMDIQYFNVKIDAEEDFVHKFVVNRAEKAEVKSKPIRSLIVLIGTVSALILSLLILTILEKRTK